MRHDRKFKLPDELEAEIQKIEAIASRRNEHFATLFETIPDAVFFKDGLGRWLMINDSAKQLFQLHDIPWQGKTDRELADLHPEFRTNHEACLTDDEQAWKTGGLVIVEENMLREDGQLATFETRKIPIFTHDGQREGLVIIGRDITARKTMDERLQRMALYDDLTGLPNAHALNIRIEQDMACAIHDSRLLAVCLLDLDHFKYINETYGRESGNEVLTVLGKRVAKVIRGSDFIARLSGDEFALLVNDLSDLEELTHLLTRVEDAIAAPIRLTKDEMLHVSASMGVVLYPFGNEETGGQILRQAEQALYESKTHQETRKRFWMLFGEEGKAPRTTAQRLLDAEALEVWYQPVLDSHANQIVGLEALARLRDEDDKIWSPAEFLPLLQDQDLFELSRQVLQQATADLSSLDVLGISLWVSVNIDPRSISSAFIASLHEIIAQSALDPSRITLEILEGSDFLEQQTILEDLLALKAEGIRLALDDVGSAYASLLRLKSLPIDEIKLDQGFIRTLDTHPQDLHFVESIQELAAGLHVDLVVEGVETEDILDAVTIFGVKFLQGYGISRPLPLAQLKAFLASPFPKSRLRPSGLLGLYTAQFMHHNMLQRTIRQDPRLLNYQTLGKAENCSIHAALDRLAPNDGGTLDRLHQEYHRAIAAMETATTMNEDWGTVEQADHTLSLAILEQFRKQRTGHDTDFFYAEID